MAKKKVKSAKKPVKVAKRKPMSVKKKAVIVGAGVAAATAAGYVAYKKMKRKR